ncbi:MAG: Uncharacterised protein [Hyphomonas sp. TMED17]|nr:MAG: Uncharacterised protein [Hyphomonas sp. TMED17]
MSNQTQQVLWPFCRCRFRILRNRSTHHNAAFIIHAGQQQIKNITTNIVIIKIDTVRCQCLDLVSKLPGFVINNAVKLQHVPQIGTLLFAAGDTNNPPSGLFRKLDSNAANRTRRCRNDDCLTAGRTANIYHAKIGGITGHTEPGQKDLWRRQLRVYFP